ncbi:NAD(P)/FAD-dependent oxidoreductase [Azospira restricta]|uniref:NAD(P)/FAD-dependent oxidoreductase n=1 Tax=Azospira restricta TaxID=404405 RepID=A0A974SM20_9RHOO|nr:NAD(P)/FAD-dependent oxidoreductase [Azospira restricta]QRJ62245.1 NAD(P)/FAD-dependent oxidoreductase [Azospira restricta]
MEQITAAIIGAGVVGLACARALAARGIEAVILERHDAFGSETSARNSEVIHAGLYYPGGSRKAALCVAGRDALYAYCGERHVAHRRCGKLIVATHAGQLPKLEALRRQGEANGVSDLRLIDAGEAKAMEPNLACVAALHSPSTGIVDSHGFMLALLGDAERDGALLALHSPVAGGRIEADGIVLEVGSGSDTTQLKARLVVNAAGLAATQVARRLIGFPPEHCPTPHYAKGNYYGLAGRAPFSRLIYPLPEPGGLGVHLTLDLGGQARFGPDVEWLPGGWIDAPDYAVDPQRSTGFYAEVRRYWPGLPDGALAPAYCGVRPKISGPQDPAADFLIQGPQTHGVRGLVNLFGIESPGLTSALAIADAVCAELDA